MSSKEDALAAQQRAKARGVKSPELISSVFRRLAGEPRNATRLRCPDDEMVRSFSAALETFQKGGRTFVNPTMITNRTSSNKEFKRQTRKRKRFTPIQPANDNPHQGARHRHGAALALPFWRRCAGLAMSTQSGCSDHRRCCSRPGWATALHGAEADRAREGSRWAFNPTFQRRLFQRQRQEWSAAVTQPMVDPPLRFPGEEHGQHEMSHGVTPGRTTFKTRRSAAFRPSVTSCSARSATGSMATSTTARWCRSRSWKRTATKTSTARNGIRSSASSIGWR